MSERNEPDEGGAREPGADDAPGSDPVPGTEAGAEPGTEAGAEPGTEGVDDVLDAERRLDADDVDAAAEVSAAVDEAFADDDPLSVALDQRDEYLDSLRRLQAEFENYKKRVAKQQADQVARAAVSLVGTLLPVLDTLDLATDHLGDAESADGRALTAVAAQLHDVLVKEGLERVDPTGEPFDPNAHEAVGHLPDEGEDAPSSGEPVVAQVMRAGYRWRGAVVRPAMVMVRG